MNVIKKINEIKLIIPCVICVLVAINFLPLFYDNATIYCLIISILIILCFNIILNIHNSFCMSLILVLFEIFNLCKYQISFISLVTSSFILVLLVKYFIDIVRKKKTIDWPIFIISIAVCLYGLIGTNMLYFSDFIAHCILVFGFYLLFEYRSEIKLIEAIKTFVIMFIVIMGIAFIFSNISTLKNFVVMDQNRFMGFTQNPNQLQILVTISLSFMVFLYFNYSIKTFSFILCSIILIIFGLLTQSKAFLLCLSILFILFIILSFQKNKKFGMYCLLICLFTIGIITCLFYDKIFYTLKRFTMYDNGDFLDSILTGRLSIWRGLLNEWSSSTTNILFGCGVMSPNASYMAHSVYVYLLYTFGIIGVVLIISAVILYVNQVKVKKIRLRGIVPLIIYLLLSIEETVLSYKFLFIIVLIILCSRLELGGKDEKHNENINNNTNL